MHKLLLHKQHISDTLVDNKGGEYKMSKMKKTLPVLVILVFILSGCNLFTNKDKLAIEETINNMDTPFSEQDENYFALKPADAETEKGVTSRNADTWYGADFSVGKWEKKVGNIVVKGSEATAEVSWKLPVTTTVTIEGQAKTVDLSMHGEGTYGLTKNSNDEWIVTSYPRICFRNAYGPAVTDITVRKGSPNVVSAQIDVKSNTLPIVTAIGYKPFYLEKLETSDNKTFIANPLLLGTANAGDKHQGVITVFSIPTIESIEYGITICYFETTILE